jgi:hypothetical protein
MKLIRHTNKDTIIDAVSVLQRNCRVISLMITLGTGTDRLGMRIRIMSQISITIQYLHITLTAMATVHTGKCTEQIS